jgi:hypothetical protein
LMPKPAPKPSQGCLMMDFQMTSESKKAPTPDRRGGFFCAMVDTYEALSLRTLSLRTLFLHAQARHSPLSLPGRYVVGFLIRHHRAQLKDLIP